MGKIIVLDEGTANKIAAGEVVERPASVVKELVENSIDAGAESISVEIKNGGISYISVVDNGYGMSDDDVEIAFERHSTSKIKSIADLDSISTLGFRGEALASIAAVSVIQMTTRVRENPFGTFIELHGGKVVEKRQAGCPAGTSIMVRNLFYNTPARYKFLKKNSTEAACVADILGRIALANPDISFKLTNNGTTVFHTPGNSDLESVIFCIYGKETVKYLCKLNYQENGIRISGYAGKPEISRANRSHQSFFVNGRYIRNKVIASAVDEAYKTVLMKNRHAFLVMNIHINPKLIDVNVHPGKMEVKFSNEEQVFRSVYNAVNNALLDRSITKMDAHMDSSDLGNVKYHAKEGKKDLVYVQQQPIDMASWGVKEAPIPSMPIENKDQKQGENKEESEIAFTSNAKNLFLDSKVIGQAFSTYIMIQHEDKLIIIDQHAAHERITYERLKEKFRAGENLSQMLIAPVAVELTHQEIEYLEKKKEFIESLGFIFESFGNNSIVLRSVPFVSAIDIGREKSLFMEVLDKTINSIDASCAAAADELLYTIACRAAVKANKKLDEQEIKGLLEALSLIENPFTCPHGRPVAVEISKHELERMFKRRL